MLRPIDEAKKLLVLDLDQTLFDDKADASVPMADKLRPYLTMFLKKVSKTYNLVLWSASPMKRIVKTMTALGLNDHRNAFQLVFK